TVKHQSQTQIAQITPQLLQLRSFCIFCVVGVLSVKYLWDCHFVIAIKAGENSTDYDALNSAFQRNLRFMNISCLIKQYNQIFWNYALFKC
ncbi:hypothetical protein, partial [Phascolarctobacterium succinatutens]|uniref:hypothetical protein n=1 Tax=Phascolarctobacterium succinatutens TaxID=626940 RepID=UPI003078AEDC